MPCVSYLSLDWLDADYDPVAQLDRVSVSEAEGHEFDSHRDRHQVNYATVRKWRNW